MGAFERAARRRRAAELERRLAELDEWDRRYGLGGVPPGHPSSRSRRRARRRRGPLVLLLVVVTLAAGAVALPEERETVRVWATAAGRSVLGLPDSTDPGGEALADRVLDAVPVLQHAPTRWEPPWGRRVLPEVDPGTGGSYAFLQTQEYSDAPVGFSPCGSIRVVVNPQGAPADHEQLVLASLARVSEASGLHLELVGETDETWSDGPRGLGSPVLVTWSDPGAVPQLREAAGLGGATVASGLDGRLWHASGQVVLDATDLSTWEQHSAVLDHELAHVLGLDHVDDQGELMAAVNMGVTGFGPGDLAGLATLGAISCPGL